MSLFSDWSFQRDLLVMVGGIGSVDISDQLDQRAAILDPPPERRGSDRRRQLSAMVEEIGGEVTHA